jgi:hypothetical protein
MRACACVTPTPTARGTPEQQVVLQLLDLLLVALHLLQQLLALLLKLVLLLEDEFAKQLVLQTCSSNMVQ